MFKRMLILVVLLGGMLLIAQAQAPQREIYTVLSYGDQAFDPETWLASAAELGARTTATWRNDREGALAYADYIHFDDGFDPETIDDAFGARWFDVTLSAYQGWREINNCTIETETVFIRLYEFSLQQNDIKYTMRYWITPTQDETRVLTLFVLYPTSEVETLDEYAELLFPEAVKCEDTGVG